jgi:hypothetical protein
VFGSTMLTRVVSNLDGTLKVHLGTLVGFGV